MPSTSTTDARRPRAQSAAPKAPDHSNRREDRTAKHEPIEAVAETVRLDWGHYAESRLHDFERRS